MNGGSGFHIDLVDVDPSSVSHASSDLSGARPWIGIHFECCGTYTRIYRSPDGSKYEGRCPHCSRPVRVGVGPHGTSARFFRAE